MDDEPENGGRDDPITDDSSDESRPNWSKRRSRRLGLSYYRRHRPYTIELANGDSTIWLVRDVATKEQLGAIVRTASGIDDKFYEPLPDALLGRRANKLIDPVSPTRTISASADQIWKYAYPARFRIWRIMNAVVVTVDSLTRLWSLAIVVFAIAVVAWSIPSVWKIKGELLNEIVTWAKELGDDNGS